MLEVLENPTNAPVTESNRMLLVISGLPAVGRARAVFLLQQEGWHVLRPVITRSPRGGLETQVYQFVSREEFAGYGKRLLFSSVVMDGERRVDYGILREDLAIAQVKRRIVTILRPNDVPKVANAFGGSVVKVFLNENVRKATLDERLRNLAGDTSPGNEVDYTFGDREFARGLGFKFVDLTADTDPSHLVSRIQGLVDSDRS